MEGQRAVRGSFSEPVEVQSAPLLGEASQLFSRAASATNLPARNDSLCHLDSRHPTRDSEAGSRPRMEADSLYFPCLLSFASAVVLSRNVALPPALPTAFLRRPLPRR